MTESSHCPLLLAIELTPDARPERLMLSTEEAAGLIDRIAVDLTRLLPGVDALGLVAGAALLDPAQVLRPGWPVFSELSVQYERHARGRTGAQLIGLGTAGGRMASAILEPEEGLGGGLLLVIPLLLIGPADLIAAIGERLETTLETEGLAGADTSWYIGRALSTPIEHARYLTHNDLCALTQIQLDQAGYGAAWQLIEAALFAARDPESVRSESGIPLLYADLKVRMGIVGYSAYGSAEQRRDSDRDALLAGFVDRKRDERLIAALLSAHRLTVRPVVLVADPTDDRTQLAQASALEAAYFIEVLAEAEAAARCAVFAHEHPDLGVVALSVVELDIPGRRVLSHGYPLQRGGLIELRAELGRRYRLDGAEQRLGTILVSDDGRELTVPAAQLS